MFDGTSAIFLIFLDGVGRRNGYLCFRRLVLSEGDTGYDDREARQLVGVMVCFVSSLARILSSTDICTVISI